MRLRPSWAVGPLLALGVAVAIAASPPNCGTSWTDSAGSIQTFPNGQVCPTWSATFSSYGYSTVSCVADDFAASITVRPAAGGTQATLTATHDNCVAAANTVYVNGNVQMIPPDFLNLSSSDGLALSVAVLSVWATAFAWRALSRALNVNDGQGEVD